MAFVSGSLFGLSGLISMAITTAAGRLHDRLAQTFGRNNLFMDVDHIPAGVDFVEYLHGQVAACDVFLAVIGPNWLDAKDDSGRRRFDNPDDFVTIEIAAALARNIRVIPVLVDGARTPKADRLPDSIKPLVRRNAVEVRNTHFGRDAEALANKVREALKSARPVTRQWPFMASAAARLIVAGSAMALLLVGWIALYQMGVPVWVPWTPRAEQPDAPGADKAKAAAEAEARAKAEQAEQERLAAAKAEEERKAKAEAEARRTGAPEDEMGRFVSKVLGSTELQWKQVFAKDGQIYRAPVLVLYHGATHASCGGVAQSAMGPFYCADDQKIYLDTSFFDQIATRFRGCDVGSSCQFSQAYVIAHEVGHHVQNLLGILPKAQQAQRAADSRAAANHIQVQVELQADCLAGVWAKLESEYLKSQDKPPIIDAGDVEAALRAVAAIGGDTLQGNVVRDSFTHGSAEQRQRWFNAGLHSGRVASCNTFAAAQL
jgi:predicted metalloprotease